MKSFCISGSPLKAAFFSVFMGNMITAMLGFTLNVLLSRFLTVAEFGRISLIFSLVVTLFTIADFGFSNTVVIFYNKYRQIYSNNPLYYLNTIYLRFWLLISCSGGLIIYFFIRNYFGMNYMESTVIFLVFVPFMLFRYLNSCNQAYGRWLKFNILNILNKFLQIAAIFSGALVLYYFAGKSRYISVLTGYAIYPFLLLIVSLIVNFRYLRFSVLKENKSSIIKDISRIAVPLGITNIFVIISMRFGYLATDKLLGSEALGIFAAANTLALVFPLITSSLMNVLLRETATRKHEFLAKIIASQKRYTPYLVMFLIAGIILSRPFIMLVFGENYAASANIFRILLVPYVGGIFFTPLQSYFYSHKAKTIMAVQFIQMAIVVTGSIFFTRFLGLTGIALAILISRLAGWIYISTAAGIILKSKAREQKSGD
jgi:O-antigen/teichoic acid export membrane protein